MAKYLKLFENHTAYNAYTANTENFIKPNVSYCVEENEVHMTPLVPTPTYDYVEIGGLKWATMNVGATAITDGGLYFQWGDTVGYTADQVGEEEGQKAFSCTDYKYWTADTGNGESGFTKYNDTDGKTVLDISDDAARANMGDLWRIPTSAECQALLDTTTSAWTTDYQGSGVSGLVLTSKADSNVNLFFPAVGDATNGSVNWVTTSSEIWLNRRWESTNAIGHCLAFSKLGVWDRGSLWISGDDRSHGISVRGVMDI